MKMENLNVPLVVLCLLAAVHFLIGAVRLFFPIKSRFHINRCGFLIAKWTEFVLIVAYIIYDNITNPYRGGDWRIPICGYAFVFLCFFLMWWAYDRHTWFKKNKEYDMLITDQTKSFSMRKPNGTMKDMFFQVGYVGTHNVYIPTPLEPYPKGTTVKVVFDCVYNMDYTLVKPSQEAT